MEESEMDESWEAPDPGPGMPGHPAPRPPDPDMCGPAAIKGGIEIPVECYDGPPRFDDVEEVINPWLGVELPSEETAQDGK